MHYEKKKLQPSSPRRQTVADCSSDPHCEEFLLGSLFFVVVLVTDVSTVTAKSVEENKFCVEMHNIEFPLLYYIYERTAYSSDAG